MNNINLAVRFLLELAGIAGAAYWGWDTGSSRALQIALAIGAPLVLIGVWSLVVAPGADSPIGQSLRMIIGSGLLLAVALGLWSVGQRTLAGVFAVLVVINTVLLLVLGD